MLASLRSRLNSFRGGNKLQDENSNVAEPAVKPNRNEYTRPAFLKLNEDELRASDNHETRPIVTPKSPSALPWNAGYAEWVFSGVVIGVAVVGTCTWDLDLYEYRRSIAQPELDGLQSGKRSFLI